MVSEESHTKVLNPELNSRYELEPNYRWILAPRSIAYGAGDTALAASSHASGLPWGHSSESTFKAFVNGCWVDVQVIFSFSPSKNDMIRHCEEVASTDA